MSVLKKLLLIAALLGLSACASQQHTADRSGSRGQDVRIERGYSALDDWFWRSRAWDPYYGALYTGYGVWNDPWLMWSLRSGRISSFWHYSYDPFFPPWRAWGWSGVFGPSFYASPFGYRRSHGYYPYYGGSGVLVHSRNGRGLTYYPTSTASADRAMENLRAAERRNDPDYGSGRTGGVTQPSRSSSVFPRDMGDTRDWGAGGSDRGRESDPWDRRDRMESRSLPEGTQREPE